MHGMGVYADMRVLDSICNRMKPLEFTLFLSVHRILCYGLQSSSGAVLSEVNINLPLATAADLKSFP